jgi:hypothetical protein
MRLRRIISGGQTGVDRGGLDAAMELGIEHGGSCPAGRRAEDGVIPAQYVMEEHTSSKYPPRTAKNICDADATLILMTERQPSRGTRLTAKIAHERKKPWLAADPSRDQHFDKVVNWLRENDPETLNIAGPRESRCPGIQRTTADFLRKVISRLREK